MMRSGGTLAGVNITPATALQVSAVYASVRVLSESIAQLPLILRRQQEDGNRIHALSHPLYQLLRWQPNPEWTAFEFELFRIMSLCLRGNAYAEIVWGLDGQIRELWPIHPEHVQIVRGDDNQLYYHVFGGYMTEASRRRSTVKLPFWKMHHVRLLSTDGVYGLSPIALHRQGIGLAAAAEQYGAAFLGNGAQPGGVLEHPGTLSDGAYKRMVGSWEARHKGPSQGGKMALLEEGMKYRPITISPQDAQYLETRQFQAVDIARIFRVPPHLINDLSNATFANIEHLGLEFVQFSLQPYFVNIEQAIRRDLLIGDERNQLFADYDVEALLRGDIQARYTAYAQGRQWGFLSANDIRQRENMPQIEGGDIYMMPLNMVPVENLSSPNDGNRSPLPTDSAANRASNGVNTESAALPSRQRRAANTRHRLYGRGRSLTSNALERVLRREGSDVLAMARDVFGRSERSAFSAEFTSLLDNYYADHADFITQQMLPTFTTYSGLVSDAIEDEVGEHDENLDRWLRGYLATYVRRHIGLSRLQISRAIDGDGDPVEAIEEMAEGWAENRPNSIAQDESVRLNNAVAVTIYAAIGVTTLRWASFGDSCPYCTALSGRTVGISEFFIPAGIEFKPDGAEFPLRPSINVRHAPAHAGCDCMVVRG